MALLLTHLAHYYTGLGEQELRQALEVLLRMGESAQRDFYAGWLALARSAERVDPGGWLANVFVELPGTTPQATHACCD